MIIHQKSLLLLSFHPDNEHDFAYEGYENSQDECVLHILFFQNAHNFQAFTNKYSHI